jgi:hypothetical protein
MPTTIAVMQPYLFPYIAYFQLMNAVDCFVSYDDVQYIPRGWVNRNRILSNGAPVWFSVPVASGPRHWTIAQRTYALTERRRTDLLRRLEGCYARAPFLAETMDIVREVLDSNDLSVAALNLRGLRVVARELGIGCEVVAASEIDVASELRGQDRILGICETLGAQRYINPIGGVELYSGDAFRERGMELFFLRTGEVRYDQRGGEFVPYLSILDLLMFQGAAGAAGYLGSYELVEPFRCAT